MNRWKKIVSRFVDILKKNQILKIKTVKRLDKFYCIGVIN